MIGVNFHTEDLFVFKLCQGYEMEEKLEVKVKCIHVIRNQPFF